MLSWSPRNDAPGSTAIYGISSRRSISAATSDPHSGAAGRPLIFGTSRVTRPTLARPQIVQCSGAPCPLLRVDPGLLDHERLPQALGHAADLIVGERLRLAGRHRVGQPLRVLLELQRQGDAP